MQPQTDRATRPKLTSRGAATRNRIVLAAAFAAVEKEFARVHGVIAGGRAALLGMGRLGSHELTEGSDVDLLLLYEHDEGAEESSGPRKLATTTYYSRLTQRLIAALTAPIGGRLIDRYPPRRVLIAYGIAHPVSLALLLVYALVDAPIGALVVAAFVSGACFPPIGSTVRTMKGRPMNISAMTMPAG